MKRGNDNWIPGGKATLSPAWKQARVNPPHVLWILLTVSYLLLVGVCIYQY